MRRSLSLPIVALFSTVPVVAQTTGAGAPPPASKPQDATAATETRKTRRILTNEDLSKSTGKISVVGNGQDDKPKAAAPPKAANANPAYVASVRNQLEKLLKQMRSEEHTSELQSPDHLVCRLLLEKKKK